MGGRGSRSRLTSGGGESFSIPADFSAALPAGWNLIASHQPLNRTLYPLLSRTGRAWHIVGRPLEAADAAVPAAVAFGMETPTLRWVRDDGVVDIYVDGMTTPDFLVATGLEPSLDKGAYVLSKRLSRALRPYYVGGLFAPEEVVIRYLDDLDAEGMKVWDGAGVISRRMLKKLTISDDLPSAKRARLERELRRAQRVEFTILTPEGQDKGHCMVADDLMDDDGRPLDFLLPRDTKGELRLNDGHTFVGVNFVHGQEEMRLDIQSVINLHPFFAENRLLDWLKEEGELFLEGMENGRLAAVLGRIEGTTTLADVAGWYAREFLVCGGDPLWSPTIVKSLVGQHLKRLRHTTLQKLRLPIPGGRQYVMPAGVGKAAGLKLTVPRGRIAIDPQRATAWVNDADWVTLTDSPANAGIADILGGADNDDALWLHPFTDHDDERKILAWRSPNQAGEYLVLRPTAGSDDLLWETTGEPLLFPAADSRKLPPRADRTQPKYLDLVGESERPSGKAYTIAALDEAVIQAQINRGILGMTCNSLMVQKALFNNLPPHPPAPLEDVVDAAVKTGADLSRVKEWNHAHTAALLGDKTPIPALLHDRLCYDRANPQPAPPVDNAHWLAELERGIRSHIQTITTGRDALMEAAKPPPAAMESATLEDIKRGAGLNRVYARRLRQLAGKRPFGLLGKDDLDAARNAALDYLSRFHPRRQHGVLRGALVSAAGGRRKGSDAVCWLQGEDGADGLAGRTLAALREIGVLDEIIQTDEGLSVYPNAEAP